MRKINLFTLLAAAMFAASMWASSFPIGDGTGLEYTWTYPDASTMTLVITYDGVGTGVMPDYDNYTNKAPWNGSTLNPKYISIQLPEGLQNIGNYAFYDYTNEALTELTIPASVTSIGIQAVRITHLERLVMQSAVAPSLGANAIPAHASSFSIIYPCSSGESYVNNWPAFYGNLTPEDGCETPKPAFNPQGDCGANAHYSFNGSTNVLTISGTGAMSNYTAGTQPWYSYKNQITSIVVENGITAIGNLAFNSLANLSSVSLPSSLTTIGQSAFGYCTSLTSISIPANVTAIGNSAFSGAGLTSISISAKVETIGDYAFQNCASLATVTFASPNSALTSIGTKAFYGTALASVTIPATTNGLTIGGQAFAVAGITSVSFASPSNVTTIDDRAFSGTGLTSVTLPATVSNLTTNRSFEQCTSLATVTFASPSKVTSIGARTFEGTAISTITLPASVTSIGGSAFRDCSNLQEVIFQGSTCPAITATNNSNNAFRGTHENLVFKCPNDDDIVMDYANTMYPYYQNGWYWERLYKMSGEHAPAPHQEGTCGYNGGVNLTWQTNSGTLTISGTGAMEEWDFLESSVAPWNKYKPGITRIEIAEGVTTIGGSAFYNCDKVKTFIIPSTVTSIGADAFFSCDNPEVEVYCYADPNNLTWNDRNCDDFLSYSPGTGTIRSASYTPGTLHLQETKCFVSSAHLAKYVEKWYQGSTDWFCGTDVNVFFAVGLNDANDAAGINAILNDTHGKNVPVMTITRPVSRDGYFVTLCLPFNMSAAQIAASPLADAEIKEFTNAAVVGGQLELTFSPVSTIEAGKPYFVKFTGSAVGAALDRLDFVNVTIDKTAPTPVKHGDVTMYGTYVPVDFPAQTGYSGTNDILFLKSENKLAWPTAAGTLKPFRCYFKVNTSGSGGAAPKRGMPARIIEVEKMPTAIENAAVDGEYNKMIQDGQLIVIKNGVKYNAQGQIVK